MADSVTYKIILHNRHIIAVIDNKFALIDTGSPITVGNENLFHFMGENYHTTANYHGATVEGLGEYIGHPIHFLVGTDILGKYQWLLDWGREIITFYRYPEQFGGTILKLREISGVPIVEFMVNGEVTSAILDTGAALQYMPRNFDAGPSVRLQEDFFPALGRFKTPVYNLPIEFGSRSFDAEFGVLPEQMATGLEGFGIRWILGSDVLRKWPILFHLRNDSLHILDQLWPPDWKGWKTIGELEHNWHLSRDRAMMIICSLLRHDMATYKRINSKKISSSNPPVLEYARRYFEKSRPSRTPPTNADSRLLMAGVNVVTPYESPIPQREEGTLGPTGEPYFFENKTLREVAEFEVFLIECASHDVTPIDDYPPEDDC